jgi:SAM-dependent MidA family methyltransferase
VVARWIDATYERLGRPDDFVVIEVGAGPGTLARSVLTAAPQWTDRYVAVELSAAQRAMHPSGVESTSTLPDGPIVGVVLANELLDNLPFRLAVFDGTWREAMVEISADGAASEVTVAAPADWTWLPAHAAHGARVPVQEAAATWVDEVRGRLAAGALLAFDYCTSRTAMLAATPWREWLRTYRGHERGAHYLRDVGAQDITAQVCLDQLPEPDVVRTQAQFLARWGIDELVAEGVAVWTAKASRPDLMALRMRSRVREAESLLEARGLGAYLAVEWWASA